MIKHFLLFLFLSFAFFISFFQGNHNLLFKFIFFVLFFCDFSTLLSHAVNSSDTLNIRFGVFHSHSTAWPKGVNTHCKKMPIIML